MTLVLLDANNLGSAGAAGTSLSNGEIETGAVFAVLGRVRDLRRSYQGPIIALHDGRSWRYDEFPEYKGNRSADPKLVALKERWKAQKPYVAKALRHLGVSQALAGNMEADDLAARFAARAAGDVLLVSGDRDWQQAISERVTWFDPIRDRRCTPRNFRETTDCDDPFQFVQMKALTGDSGDNIPGVGGCGPKAARWIFDNHGSVDALFNNAIMPESRDWPAKIRNFVDDEAKRAIYQRNLRLVWLSAPGLPKAENMRIVQGAYDENAFLDLCETLGFASILNNSDRWLEPFAVAAQERQAA